MKKIPIVLLSGFLGSGKTTLLSRIVDGCLKKGISPAVLMNEVGDVNLDGQLVNGNVPMREMLGGCICCTIRGDVGMEIGRLVQEASPDFILIETTGVANPMDLFDGVTEAALLFPIEVAATITVVDAGLFLRLHRVGRGRTYRLLADQVRCASSIVLNKSDLASAEELEEARGALASLNPHASIAATVRCAVDDDEWASFLQAPSRMTSLSGRAEIPEREREHGHDHEHDHEQDQGRPHAGNPHSYDHLMVHTHDFPEPVDLGRFERLIAELPDCVYRAKGIFTAAGSGERMMFQWAYRQLELFPIRPQGEVRDVAVFMGEQIPKDALTTRLERFAAAEGQMPSLLFRASTLE